MTVNAVDANWNLINTNDTVAISSSDANAALPANAALISGTKNFSITFKTAGSATATASNLTHTAISSSTTPSIAVQAGAFTKLQLLVPGESAAPGTATGKTGAPVSEQAATAFSVTINAVDANWNLVSNITDTVGISSSDNNATLPSSTALVSGTQSLSVTLNTAGAQRSSNASRAGFRRVKDFRFGCE